MLIKVTDLFTDFESDPLAFCIWQLNVVEWKIYVQREKNIIEKIHHKKTFYILIYIQHLISVR